jgi:hypothetical protein
MNPPRAFPGATSAGKRERIREVFRRQNADFSHFGPLVRENDLGTSNQSALLFKFLALLP